MTRFSIKMSEAIEMSMGFKVFRQWSNFNSKIPSYRVVDLAKVFKDAKVKFVGIRHGVRRLDK